MGAPDRVDISVGIVACNYLGDVKRCVESAFKWLGNRNAEVVVVDNGSNDGTDEWLEGAATEDDQTSRDSYRSSTWRRVSQKNPPEAMRW